MRATSPSSGTAFPAAREYLLPMVIAIVLVAPVLEELLHRGLIFDLLSRRVGAIAASGIGTVLFVGMHFVGASGQVEPIRLVSLVTFSLAMYVVRVRWNSLILCVLAHMVLNLIGFAAIAFAASA